MKKVFNVLYVLIFAGLLVIQLNCGSNSRSETRNGNKAMAIPVEADNVIKGSISAFFSGTATIEAEKEALVSAMVSGVIEKIHVEEGDYVKEGQVLATLDGEMLKLESKQMEVLCNKQKKELSRNEELFKRNLISAEVLDRTKFEYESQKALYDRAKLQVYYTSIRAPFDGIVSERMIKVGNLLQANQHTFKITSFEPLLAVLHIPERELSTLHIDQTAELTFDALDGEKFSGIIDRISPVVDPETGTFKVTIEVNDSSFLLKPGMFTRVNILYDMHDNTLLIPKNSLVKEDTESSVYIVLGDTVVFKQTVSTGFENSDYIEITEGLNEGDVIVTTGMGSLKDSAKIEIVEPMKLN
ncbi:efflux RND transporter periplasmic adaptor subunit [candidate division KSB1 bacterium]